MTHSNTEIGPNRGGRTNRYYSYDSAGRMSSMNTGTGTFGYTYTPDGRVATKVTPDGKTQTFTYTDGGLVRTQQITGQALFTYTYDESDRLISVEKTVSGTKTYLHRYEYDSGGRIATWRYKSAAIRTSYGYSSGGDLQEVRREIITPAAGSNTSAENAIVAACFADILSASCTSTYRDHIRALANIWAGPASFPGTYAPISRYMHSNPYVMTQFALGSGGQVTSKTSRQTSNVAVSYGYDTRGNLTTEAGATAASYDAQNRLTMQKAVNGFSVANTWSSDGLLTRQSGTTYDAPPIHQLDFDENGQIVTYKRGAQQYDIAWDALGLAAIVDGSTFSSLYGYFSPRGDLISVYRFVGNRHDELEWSPWGERNVAAGATPPELAFQYGGRDGSVTNSGMAGAPGSWDLVTWMGARFYDPRIARFRQVDPLPGQEGASDTAYSYASNDPINRTDPTGLTSQSKLWNQAAEGISCVREMQSIGKVGSVKAGVYCYALAKVSGFAFERSVSAYGFDMDGGPPDVLRHQIWQSSITWGLFNAPELGIVKSRKIANKIGQAHERSCVGSSLYCRVSRRMDLRNNMKGRFLVRMNQETMAGNLLSNSSMNSLFTMWTEGAKRNIASGTTWVYRRPGAPQWALRSTDMRDMPCYFNEPYCQGPLPPEKIIPGPY